MWTCSPAARKPVAPSAITAKTKTYLIKDGVGSFAETSEPRALDAAELPGIVQDYRHAARHAITTAGFDGVEVHGANGYLLDQFLKTGSNQRTDDYGGSMENRARLLLEVMRAVTEEIGGGRTGIRLSPVTPANDVATDDAQALFEYVLRQLAPLNLAYIHIIEGATGGPREIADRPFDYGALKTAYQTGRRPGPPGWSTTATTRPWLNTPWPRARPGGLWQAVHRQPRPGAPPARQRAAEHARQAPPSTAAAKRATPTTRRWPEGQLPCAAVSPRQWARAP
jgi:hypothetical protein